MSFPRIIIVSGFALFFVAGSVQAQRGGHGGGGGAHASGGAHVGGGGTHAAAGHSGGYAVPAGAYHAAPTAYRSGYGLGYSGLGYGGLGYGGLGYGGFGVPYYGLGYGLGNPGYSYSLGGVLPYPGGGLPSAYGTGPLPSSGPFQVPPPELPGQGPPLPAAPAAPAADPGLPVAARVAAVAKLTVVVPEGGQVWFDNVLTPTQGTKWAFTSEKIDPGKTLTVAVKARWGDGDDARSYDLPIRLQGGDDLIVDLSRSK